MLEGIFEGEALRSLKQQLYSNYKEKTTKLYLPRNFRPKDCPPKGSISGTQRRK